MGDLHINFHAGYRTCMWQSVAVANLLRHLILRWAYLEYTSICFKQRLQMSTKIPNSKFWRCNHYFPFFSVFFCPCAFSCPFLIFFNSSSLSAIFLYVPPSAFLFSFLLFVSSFFVTSSSFIYSFFPHPHYCFLLSIFLFQNTLPYIIILLLVLIIIPFFI